MNTPPLRLVSIIAFAVVATASAVIFAARVFPVSPATDRSLRHDVLHQKAPVVETPVWPGYYPQKNDDAVLTLGLLKNFAADSYDEFEKYVPGGTGPALDALMLNWSDVNPAAHLRNSKIVSTISDDSVCTLGMLKSVASLFYARLADEGFADGYPWNYSSHEPSDLTMANVGEAEYLFSFELIVDRNHNGIPDEWEEEKGLNPNEPGDEKRGWLGTSITWAQEYRFEVFYAQRQIQLVVISGNGQTWRPNRSLRNPIVVAVRDLFGNPISSAPVRITLPKYDGKLAAAEGGGGNKGLFCFTDADGKIDIHYTLPSAEGIHSIQIDAGNKTLNITAAVSYDLPPAAPTNVEAEILRNGTTRITWVDSSTDEGGFAIERSIDTQDWVEIGRVPANSTSFIDPATVKTPTYYYRVVSIYADE